MAYVGTPSYLGSDVNTLASILSGESSTAAGQQAVASVMANRAAAGGFVTNNNYGGILGIALGQNQFQGQSAPTAQSLGIAQQALDGTLPDNTNGALFYGAPANGNASWLNNLLGSGTGVKIGGNTFSDQQGPASPAFQARLANGGTAGSTVGDSVGINSNDPTADYLSAANQGVGSDTPNLQDSDFEGLSDSDIVGSGTTLPSDPASSIGNVNVSSMISSLGGSNAANPAAAAAGGGGTPIDITDFSGPDTAITGAGKAVQAGAGTVGSDVQTSAGGIAGTAASIFNGAQSYVSSAVIILGLMALGLVLVAFGLGMFKHNSLIPAV